MAGHHTNTGGAWHPLAIGILKDIADVAQTMSFAITTVFLPGHLNNVADCKYLGYIHTQGQFIRLSTLLSALHKPGFHPTYHMLNHMCHHSLYLSYCHR